jgi:hypothetical protein
VIRKRRKMGKSGFTADLLRATAVNQT